MLPLCTFSPTKSLRLAFPRPAGQLPNVAHHGLDVYKKVLDALALERMA